MTASPALSIIIPAYNEEAAIGEVIRTWVTELDRLQIDYELRVYDDGSRDRTVYVLQELLAQIPRLIVTTHENRGHGPTILRGYHEARGEWIFQTDGDGECAPEAIEELWRLRDDYDFLIGYRVDRYGPLIRRCVTIGSRLIIWALFGAGIRDVNSPYRLMRRTRLQPLLRSLPESTFAPNAILSGLAVRYHLRTCERPVRWMSRRTGRSSIAGWKLLRRVARSFREALAVAFAQ